METLLKKQWPENLEEYEKEYTLFDFIPQSGVYFLFENNDLKYIGKSKDIYTRVLHHSKNFSFDVIGCLPVENNVEAIETQLIQHFRPKLNITDNPDNNPKEKPQKYTYKNQIKHKSPIIQKDSPRYKLTDLPIILMKASEDILRKILETIPDMEKDVIIKRHGLFDNEPQTLQQIADTYNLTRERIRQIQQKATRRIQHPIRMNKLLESIPPQDPCNLFIRCRKILSRDSQRLL